MFRFQNVSVTPGFSGEQRRELSLNGSGVVLPLYNSPACGADPSRLGVVCKQIEAGFGERLIRVTQYDLLAVLQGNPFGAHGGGHDRNAVRRGIEKLDPRAAAILHGTNEDGAAPV